MSAQHKSQILGVHNNQINYAFVKFSQNPFDSDTLFLFNKHLV